MPIDTEEFVDNKYGATNPDDVMQLEQAEARINKTFQEEGMIYPRTVHDRYIMYRASAGNSPMTFEEYKAQQSSRSKPEGKEK